MSSFARPDGRGPPSLHGFCLGKVRTELSDPHERFSRARAPAPHVSSRALLYFMNPGCGLIRSRFCAGGDGQAVPGVDGGHGQSQVGQFFIGEVRADFFVNLVGNVAVGDARDGFRLLLLNQARAARLRRIIRNRSDSAPLGTTQFAENSAGWKLRPIKAKSKASDTSFRPTRHFFAGEGARATFSSRARLHFSDPWQKAGRFPAPCARRWPGALFS